MICAFRESVHSEISPKNFSQEIRNEPSFVLVKKSSIEIHGLFLSRMIDNDYKNSTQLPDS